MALVLLAFGWDYVEMVKADEATAVAIFYFDPSRLNEAQRNFITHEFPDWPPVIEYLNNPPRN